MNFKDLKQRINGYTLRKVGKEVINDIRLDNDTLIVDFDCDASVNQLETALKVFWKNLEYTEEWISLEKIPNLKLNRT